MCGQFLRREVTLHLGSDTSAELVCIANGNEDTIPAAYVLNRMSSQRAFAILRAILSCLGCNCSILHRIIRCEIEGARVAAAARTSKRTKRKRHNGDNDCQGEAGHVFGSAPAKVARHVGRHGVAVGEKVVNFCRHCSKSDNRFRWS
jgi:hypothetical protein